MSNLFRLSNVDAYPFVVICCVSDGIRNRIELLSRYERCKHRRPRRYGKGAHGLPNPNGPEPGDLPNIFIGEDGSGEMEVFSTFISLVEGPNNLLDADGSTFVIHENADDHITQPIGGSGARVACGLIVANPS